MGWIQSKHGLIPQLTAETLDKHTLDKETCSELN